MAAVIICSDFGAPKIKSAILSTVFPSISHKVMGLGASLQWEIDGETVETMSDFIFGGSKITADGDCSHEIKRRLLLGRKVMTNLDSILLCRLRSI